MIHLKVTALTALLITACVILVLGAGTPSSSATPVASSFLPLPSSLPLDAYERQLYNFLGARRYEALGWVKDKRVRDTGAFINGTYYGVHPAVRIFYSPEVYAWLKAGRPDVPIPDGAMIIKEMFAAPAARYEGMSDEAVEAALFGYTVMVKDSSGSKDGWFWAYYGPGQEVDDNTYPFDYPNAGFGQYCVRCHSSAESEFTFSSLRNIEGEPGEPIQYRVDASWIATDPNDPALLRPHIALAAGPAPDAVASSKPVRVADPEFLETFNSISPVDAEEVVALPPLTFDHVVAPASPPEGSEHFLTSDQCMSCHDGQGPPFGPNMYLPPDDTHAGINLSPFGEWNWSMMGLAGRDPIFYAQLESEITLHPTQSDTIQNLCLRCHGVMGQRQWHSDGNKEPFTLDKLFIANSADPNHKYGALARDGISCMVCHQIVNEGKPLRDIVTGQFEVSAPGPGGEVSIYGPFKDPATLAMKSALGLVPEENHYVEDSRLCASCHTIFLPVLDESDKQVGEGFEQATYLEWLNSAYRTELGGGGSPQSCQDCHMTDELHGTKLAFQIANIQDQTYPEADHLAPLKEITVPIRGLKDTTLPPGLNDYGDESFRRHTLLGINQFGLEMFRQFDHILGVRKTDYMTGSDNGLTFAISESDRLAKEASAEVEILTTELDGSKLTSQVKVTNLTGHRFPSGVGFRRAFIEFEVIDGHNNVIWASGRSNSLGVIVDENGAALPSEFHEVLNATTCAAASGGCEQAYEPHYETITRQDQAQIYEELTKNPEGRFTTSFLGRMTEVKDNRLLPKGWTREGPAGFKAFYSDNPQEGQKALDATRPEGEALQDTDFLDGTGSDIITYRMDLPAGVLEQIESGLSVSVRASLYYQAIPPFYLQERFTTASGDNAKRLHYMASHLNLEGTNIENWKLLIQSASATIPPK